MKYWQPQGTFSSFGMIWNVTVPFFISYAMESCQIVFILLANGNCLSHHIRQLNHKFLGPFKISSTAPLYYNGYNPISFLQDMANPSVEDCFILYVLSYGIFCNLDHVWLHKIGQLLPWHGATFPLRKCCNQLLTDSLLIMTIFWFSMWRAESFFLCLMRMLLTIHKQHHNGHTWLCNDVSCIFFLSHSKEFLLHKDIHPE